MLVDSLQTIVQPHLPKYLASTLRLMCLGTFSFDGLGGCSRKEWKWLRSVLLVEPIPLSLFKRWIEIPPKIQSVKRANTFLLLLILLGVKVLEHILHLYLELPEADLPQITVLFEGQFGHEYL